MATLHQSGSWSTPSILAGYGLSATVGPIEPTPADVKRLNSRSGGKHSGQGNWMQNYRPTPIMKTDRPKKMYDYETGDLPVVPQRLSGKKRKVQKFKGLKPYSTIKRGANRDADDEGQNGDRKDLIRGWLSDVNTYRTDTGTGSTNGDAGDSDDGDDSDDGKGVRFLPYPTIPDREAPNNNNIGPNNPPRPPPARTDTETAALGQLNLNSPVSPPDVEMAPADDPEENQGGPSNAAPPPRRFDGDGGPTDDVNITPPNRRFNGDFYMRTGFYNEAVARSYHMRFHPQISFERFLEQRTATSRNPRLNRHIENGRVTLPGPQRRQPGTTRNLDPRSVRANRNDILPKSKRT